ncbi:DUF1364 domain-containing protein [Escherichia coli]
MANLRKEARGRECQVRIYGVCNGNPETTVLAHYRMAGICGTGMKPDDLIGAWACSDCHAEIDRRTMILDNKDARLYHLEGVIRTQAILLKEGKITTAESNISALKDDYVSKTATATQSLASPLNVTTSYSVGGTKVIGARQTGWTAATGTDLRGSFNANQTYTVSATYTRSEMSAMATGLQQARQRIKALEDALRTHGLID